MIYLAQGEYLLLLLLIPLLFVFYAIYRRRWRRNAARLGDAELVEQMMPAASAAKGWLKISLLAAAWFFFVIGLARPQLGARLKEHEANGIEVMIALDVSNSMLAEDYSPNRLERSKLAISRLVDKLQGDRIGLIVFAGESFVQLPITADYVSAKIFLNSISTESVPIQGTALAEALVAAARSFSSQSERSRAIILITDGENHEDDAVKAAEEAGNEGIRVFTIGVGSTKGALIKIDGSYINDENGSPVVSKLDEKVLLEIAKVGNGAYIHATDTDFGLEKIVDEIAKMDDEEFQSVVFEEYDEQFMYFLGISLFFFTLAALVSARKKSWKLF